jgi:hypothetical protein
LINLHHISHLVSKKQDQEMKRKINESNKLGMIDPNKRSMSLCSHCKLELP